MESDAIVTRVDGRYAVIEPARSGGCGRCHEAGGCAGGSSVIGQMFGPSCKEFRVLNTIDARPGEHIVVSLGEGDMLRVALMVYLLPVLFLVAGACAGMALARAPSDAAAFIGAAAGFLIAVAIVAGFQARARRDGRLQPVLARRGEFRGQSRLKSIS